MEQPPAHLNYPWGKGAAKSQQHNADEDSDCTHGYLVEKPRSEKTPEPRRYCRYKHKYSRFAPDMWKPVNAVHKQTHDVDSNADESDSSDKRLFLQTCTSQEQSP